MNKSKSKFLFLRREGLFGKGERDFVVFDLSKKEQSPLLREEEDEFRGSIANLHKEGPRGKEGD